MPRGLAPHPQGSAGWGHGERQETAPSDRTPARRSAAFTGRETVVLLALTALPVAMTTVLMRALRPTGLVDVLFADLHPSYVAFVVYSFSNWVTFGIVVGVAGLGRLRAHGLRLRVDAKRAGAAVVAFAGGLAVYGGVSWFLTLVGLPGVGGMDYPEPSAAEIVLLLACVVVTAAFCEEVFFRVLWIGALGDRIPQWSAAAASLVAFAVIHYPYFGLGGVIFISVWAILPATLFIAFGDVTPSLAMHLMNNVFAYIVVPLFLR